MAPTTVVNLHREPYDTYIGRAGRGMDGYFGNPFPITDRADPRHLQEVMARYSAWFHDRVKRDAPFRRRVLDLRGKRLGCFCKPGPCHGDVIAAWVDAQPMDASPPGAPLLKAPERGLLALTLHRPWPWAVLHAGKPIENRGWDPPHSLIGKHLALHAGMAWDAEGAVWITQTFGLKVPLESDHPKGAIVGVVKVLGVRGSANGDPWFSGPRAWEFGDVVELARPIPCRGMQKLWRVPPHLLPELRAAYASARRPLSAPGARSAPVTSPNSNSAPRGTR